jgi:RNA polymerase sigma-70 factor (ECF subfamily)
MDKKQSFENIIQQNKGIIYKVANAYCKADDDRKDLVQEIQIQIWHSLDRYDSTFKMSTWLYRIALNVAISFYRKATTRNKYFSRISNDEIIHMPVREDTKDESNLALLEKFIFELKELDKALILLHLEEKSHQEIADILGISVSNVSTKISRIKEKLRQQFLKIRE